MIWTDNAYDQSLLNHSKNRSTTCIRVLLHKDLLRVFVQFLKLEKDLRRVLMEPGDLAAPSRRQKQAGKAAGCFREPGMAASDWIH